MFFFMPSTHFMKNSSHPTSLSFKCCCITFLSFDIMFGSNFWNIQCNKNNYYSQTNRSLWCMVVYGLACSSMVMYDHVWSLWSCNVGEIKKFREIKLSCMNLYEFVRLTQLLAETLVTQSLCDGVVCKVLYINHNL